MTTRSSGQRFENICGGRRRALFLLDTPMRLGESEPPSENEDLAKLLADWGVTPNKDLALDLSGVGSFSVWAPKFRSSWAMSRIRSPSR